MYLSIHRLLAEPDNINLTRASFIATFNPQAPCGARQGTSLSFEQPRPPFNPQAPCGARLASLKAKLTRKKLSIHRLLAEPDYIISKLYDGDNLSIHRLLAEPDNNMLSIIVSRAAFQSTGSLRSPTSFR